MYESNYELYKCSSAVQPVYHHVILHRDIDNNNISYHG